MSNKIIEFKNAAIQGSSVIKIENEDQSIQQQSKLIAANTAMAEMYNIAKEKFNTELENHIQENNNLRRKNVILSTEIQRLYEHNKNLKSENDVLNVTINRLNAILKKSMPTHIILFLIVNSIIMTFSATLAILFYSTKFYVIDIYYVLCTFIISATLFCTALRALGEWRKILYEKK